jgi:hypothetical protein
MDPEKCDFDCLGDAVTRACYGDPRPLSAMMEAHAALVLLDRREAAREGFLEEIPAQVAKLLAAGQISVLDAWLAEGLGLAEVRQAFPLLTESDLFVALDYATDRFGLDGPSMAALVKCCDFGGSLNLFGVERVLRWMGCFAPTSEDALKVWRLVVDHQQVGGGALKTPPAPWIPVLTYVTDRNNQREAERLAIRHLPAELLEPVRKQLGGSITSVDNLLTCAMQGNKPDELSSLITPSLKRQPSFWRKLMIRGLKTGSAAAVSRLQQLRPMSYWDYEMISQLMELTETLVRKRVGYDTSRVHKGMTEAISAYREAGAIPFAPMTFVQVREFEAASKAQKRATEDTNRILMYFLVAGLCPDSSFIQYSLEQNIAQELKGTRNGYWSTNNLVTVFGVGGMMEGHFTPEMLRQAALDESVGATGLSLAARIYYDAFKKHPAEGFFA